jgi:hypothetical protein
MQLWVLQSLEGPVVQVLHFEQELHLMPEPLNEIVHLHLEGLLYVSSCASSGN